MVSASALESGGVHPSETRGMEARLNEDVRRSKRRVWGDLGDSDGSNGVGGWGSLDVNTPSPRSHGPRSMNMEA